MLQCESTQRHLTLPILIIFLLWAGICLAQQTPVNDTFTNQAGTGLWNNGRNWSAGRPGPHSSVQITGTGSASSVRQDTSARIYSLTVNSGDSWTLFSGKTLTIEGGGNSTVNDGLMTLDSIGQRTELMIDSRGVTLSGGGTLRMSNNTNNLILGSVPDAVLTNQETIAGSGNIGQGSLGLVNSGIIDAVGSRGLIIAVSQQGFINNAALEVSKGSQLEIHGSANLFKNYSHNTLTGGTYDLAGNLYFSDTHVNITTNAATIILEGGQMLTGSGRSAKNALNLTENAATGVLILQGGQNFATPLGANFTNDGTLMVGAKSTFDVVGHLTNFKNHTLTGGTYYLSGTLDFRGADIVTNAATLILDGGRIVDSSSRGSNGLRNFSTNAANGTFSIQGGHTFTTGGDFTNDGTLMVGAKSTFIVNRNLLNFHNHTLTGGTYDLSGTLGFAGADIRTNAATLILEGGRILDTHGKGPVDGLRNLATNAAAGQLTLEAGDHLTTAEDFSNAGSLSVNSGSTLTVQGRLTNTGTINTVGSLTTLDVTGNAANSGWIKVGLGSSLEAQGGYIQTGGSAFTDVEGILMASTVHINGGLHIAS